MVMVLLSAAAASGAAWLWYPSVGAARRRLPSAAPPRRRELSPDLLAAGVALSVFVVLGGVLGALGGVAVGVAVRRYLVRQRDSAMTDERARRALQLPLALEVLAACLSVGATQLAALDAVARGMGGSLRDDLACVAGAMRVGADASEAWSLIDAPDVQALGAVLSRAQVTGAPASALIAVLADQYRQRARTVAMDAARALGVRATGPLGLCFLPAFVLIAVVPLVTGLVPGLS
jgi:pilus assembly protein TadC